MKPKTSSCYIHHEFYPNHIRNSILIAKINSIIDKLGKDDAVPGNRFPAADGKYGRPSNYRCKKVIFGLLF